MPPQSRYRFGSFCLEPSSRLLERDGKPVSINSRAFELLLTLIKNPGRVVTKDELMKTLWPDTQVEEANLAQAVSALRRALGDTPSDHRYIVTVPARGYIFTAPVTQAVSAELRVRGAARGLVARPTVLLATLVAVLAIIWFFVTRLGLGSKEAHLSITPFTSYPGEELFPAFSPDGKQIAFSWNGENERKPALYVKLIGVEKPLRLTNSNDDRFPAWSPDGQQIAFLRFGEDRGFFVVPSLGGPARKVSDSSPDRGNALSRAVDWSPDGRSLAISDKGHPMEPLSIFSASIATGARRRLTFPAASALGDASAAFSPDGKALAFVRRTTLEIDDIYLMASGGGQPRRVTFDDRAIAGLAWTSDGREIVFSSTRGGTYSLWRVPVSGGAVKRVLAVGEEIYQPTISRQGHRLAYVKTAFNVNLWRIAIGQPKPPTKLISSTLRELAPQYSPDGNKIAFVSTRSGAAEIWVCDSEAQNVLQLTSFGGPPARAPRWSPDGANIAFDARAAGNSDIYVISANGGPVRRLTTETSEEEAPSWSRDGRWIYFGSNRTGIWQIWRQPSGGGAAEQITKQGGFAGFESPDGNFFYYARSRTGPGLWRVPVKGGDEVRILEAPAGGDWNYFAVAARGIFFLDRRVTANGRVASIRLFDPVKDQITSLAELQLWPTTEDPGFPGPGLTVSPDGRWIVYPYRDPRDQRAADIMLVENFR